MRFEKVISHLSVRGFVTRNLWQGHAVLFFGMDNSPHISSDYNMNSANWSPNLEEINASDWIVLPYFWNGCKDDFLPFNKNDKTLKNLKSLGLRKQGHLKSIFDLIKNYTKTERKGGCNGGR